MKLVQKLVIGAALFALAPSAFAVDSMFGDSVAEVREREQIVSIKGPAQDVKAILLQPTETSPARISIVKTDGGQMIELESNDQLGLVVKGQNPINNLSSIIDEDQGNLTITLESEDKTAETHLTVGYDSIDKRFELISFQHSRVDMKTPNGQLAEDCYLNLVTGAGVDMGHYIRFNKKEVAFKDLSKSQELFSCAAWIK